MANSTMETDSTFTCIICLDHPQEPLNCRYCSKFVCTSCIDSWSQTSATNGLFSCPNCRKLTQRSEFIKLTWLQDHLEWINDRTKEFQRTTMNECSQHTKQELCIYCSTCSKAVCAQCILPMFNGEHIDHTHSRLNAIQQRLFAAIDEQEEHLQSDLDQLEKCIQNKKLIMNQILTRRKERLDELEEFQTKIKTEIEFKVTKTLKNFHDEQNVLIKEKADYNTRHTKLKGTIEAYNQTELLDKEKELLQQILQRAIVPEPDKIDLPDDLIQSSLTLPWQTYEFVIEQFSVKRQNKKRILSPQIRLDHNQYWTLMIYPNGNGRHKGEYLCVMLQLSKGMSQSIDYNIIIELVHQHHDDSKHNHALKGIQSFKEGQSNGFDQFYKLNNLSKDGYLDTETDSMKLRFKLCPLSIIEERKLFQWQIESFNETEQNQEMKNTTDELTHLPQENLDVERKRTRPNHDNRDELFSEDDRRHHMKQIGTIIFPNEKRFRH